MSALAAYEAGLAGAACWTVDARGRRRSVPVRRWTGAAAGSDLALVAAAVADLPRRAGRPAVLDVGCGPGRLALAAAAQRPDAFVAGLDISPFAVSLARARGVHAWLGDVLDTRPGPRRVWDRARWDRILLADGNLGIGADPAALLGRLGRLLAPGGRILADVLPAGGVVQHRFRVEAGDGGPAVGGYLAWAWVGAGAAQELGLRSGLVLQDVQRLGRRGERTIATWTVGR